MATLRIGTRGSELALWQANHVAGALRARGHQLAIEIIKTSGDKFAEAGFAEVGALSGTTKGIFTKEIEEALRDGRVDLAVHSLKDLPTELPAGFRLVAILKREDARDALVSKQYQSLGELPKGARVGTSSLRREAQLRALRRDLKVLPLRGNVGTRLEKLERNEFDAIVLASAGLRRLGREAAARQFFEYEGICPAAGQGALAIEVRADDEATREALKFMDDAGTRGATECERALLAALGGGCQVPIGAYAEASGSKLRLLAKVGRRDGSEMLMERGEGDDPKKLGVTVAQKLIQRGAAEILREIYGTRAAVPQQP
jgi:hydroxymethylbilane synthase